MFMVKTMRCKSIHKQRVFSFFLREKSVLLFAYCLAFRNRGHYKDLATESSGTEDTPLVKDNI